MLERERLDALLGRVTTAGGSRERLPILEPLGGHRLAEVPACTAADVAAAAARARSAQPAWAALTPRERCRVLLRVHDLVLDRQAEAIDLVRAETGKARRDAFEEVVDVALVARYYGVRAPRQLRVRRRRGLLPLLTRVREHRHPVGVVGFITPWNYPLVLALTDALPALAAGNAALLKPDAQTSLTALWAAELLSEAGLPAGLFQVLTGRGPELGPPLIDAVDHIAFTGSTRTGRLVAARAAERLIGCSLELGGKNAMVVLADSPVERAAEGAARALFANAGQLCVSIERVYVHSALWERFVPRLVERTRALRLGGQGWESDVGSLVSAAQLERVEAHVRDALDRGATLLAGGRARPDLGPFFYEPTLLANVSPDMAMFDEESFGPLAALYAFDDVDEVVERVNASAYGLSASIWTGDEARGRALATRLLAGSVNINEGYAAAWGSTDSPMGGFKQSGLGRRHGAEGILRFTESQTIAAQRLRPLAPPPGADGARFARGATMLLRLARRLPGLR